MKVARNIKLLGVRLLLYPFLLVALYLGKDIFFSREVSFDSNSVASIMSVAFIFYFVDIISTLIFFNKSYWRTFVLYIVVFFLFLVLLQYFGIKVQVINIMILVLISFITWGLAFFLLKKEK
jgi:hypothetical protein